MKNAVEVKPASKETLRELRATLLDILKANRADEVTIKALETLHNAIGHPVVIRDCVFTDSEER